MQYDCIIPLSGGTESTALLYDCVQRGLTPLCFHVELGYWDKQSKAANNIAEALNVDLRIVEYINDDPCADKEKTSQHFNELWGSQSPPMFFVWANIAQLMSMCNPQIHRVYYGFNAGIRFAGDTRGDSHSEWVDDHFRSMERVLSRIQIPVKFAAPLRHLSKLDQWNSIPKDIQELVHTCVHPTLNQCGKCSKCDEFNLMQKSDKFT